jgi:AraC family transcriptional activator of mtrCDE
MNVVYDRLIHWLVSSLELETTLFHVGQYCGSWRASTAGRAKASFHLVLDGNCYLHIPQREPIALQAQDAVFLLRDLPHFLSPFADATAPCEAKSMQSLSPHLPDGTGLACGFFQFRGMAAELLVESFPDFLLLRADAPSSQSSRSIFELIRREASLESSTPSPLINRLTEILLFYLVRDFAQHSDVMAGAWAVASRPQFVPLLERLLENPGQDWSTDDMARVVHMSRTRFFKQFVDICGQPPAQFLLNLRMNIAAQRLRTGESITRVAESVGYQSPAAFNRAFKKIIGSQPGVYQRTYRASPAN